MKIKNLVQTASVYIIFLFAINIQANAQQQPLVGFTLGELVTSLPDSIYKAKIDVFIDDSAAVHSIHIVVLDSSVSVYDSQFVVSNIQLIPFSNDWQDGHIASLDIPDINPFIKKRYFVELLSIGGQLLLQIEKEF